MTTGKTPPNEWLDTAQKFQQNLVQQWTQMAQAFPGAAAQSQPRKDAGSVVRFVKSRPPRDSTPTADS